MMPVISEKELFKGRVFDVVREELELAPGKIITRDIVKHPGAVVILPQMEDGSLVLVRQYRQALRRTILEFPAGTLERGENPFACAQRELTEEIGYAADDWVELGTLYPSPGLCSEIQYCYLARSLRESKAEGDEDEVIEVERLSVEAVEKAIREGEFCDAKSLGLFLRARLERLV